MPLSRPLPVFGLAALMALGACATPAPQSEAAPQRPPAATATVSAQAASQAPRPDFVPGTPLGDGRFVFEESRRFPGCGVWRQTDGSGRIFGLVGVTLLPRNFASASRVHLGYEKFPGACPKINDFDGNPIALLREMMTYSNWRYRIPVENLTCEGGSAGDGSLTGLWCRPAQ
jgi:hypothetical protein